MVQEAFDGVIGINEFEMGIDVVFIGVDIPRISHLETIDLLKKKKPELIIVVLTNDFVIKS